MNFKSHKIRLDIPGLEKGKISFSMLQKLSDLMEDLAEGTLRLYLEGSSSSKRGSKPDWMTRALDFNLVGLEKGSTVLLIEAPLLTEAVGSYQKPMFTDLKLEDLQNETAFGLTVNAFSTVLNASADSDLLDRNLLRKMQEMKKFIPKEGGHIELFDRQIEGEKGEHVVDLTPQAFESIRIAEEKTPESRPYRVVGTLDMIQHSSRSLCLETKTGKFKATLGPDLDFNHAFDFFGKEMQVDGIANFRPGGKMSGVVIQRLSHPSEGSDVFKNGNMFVQSELDLGELSRRQNYKGTSVIKIDRLIERIEIKESVEELLLSLRS